MKIIIGLLLSFGPLIYIGVTDWKLAVALLVLTVGHNYDKHYG